MAGPRPYLVYRVFFSSLASAASAFPGTPANIRINLILSESRVAGLHRRR